MKKLVRDNIPEIIKANGEIVDFYIAKDEEYKDELFRKLSEEAQEVVDEKNNIEKLKEEIGDLLEIIDAILKLEKIEMDDIIKIKENKNGTNGGFNNRIILILDKKKTKINYLFCMYICFCLGSILPFLLLVFKVV